MVSCLQPRSLAAVLGLLGTGASCQGQEDARVAMLEQRVSALQKSLTESNQNEKKAVEQLNQVRERLEALGKNLLGGGDDRLIQAAADLQLANERLKALQDASGHLAASINDYLRQAVVSDPEARLRVETSLRELDVQLGFKDKPRPALRTGSLQQANIVSIDQKSGLLVLNVGEAQGARIGMSFVLVRSNQPYGKAIIADLRKDVCGAFVERLDRPSETARLGDSATLETQPNR
ncbi:hypothetical protein [Luteolibacter sp. LG18]|uniref:hypothetical protein n=1 Tax=Luteolibacter sp. LG18 TaxID=2819286 RepID=UPI002B28CA1F|nr:hypothetical protein llg_19490 [Luteolibacter sp. LG18]